MPLVVANNGHDAVDPSNLGADHDRSKLLMIGLDPTEESEEGLVAMTGLLRRLVVRRIRPTQDDWSKTTMPSKERPREQRNQPIGERTIDSSYLSIAMEAEANDVMENSRS
jgi:hypothetical protein